MTITPRHAGVCAILSIIGFARLSMAQATTKPAADKVESKGPALRGRIVDDAGKPLKGAKVILYGGTATRWKVDEAATDEEGRYHFDTVRGTMTLDETAKRWDQYVGVRIEHPTHVEADGESWRDLQIKGLPEHVETLDFKLTLAGHVDGLVKDARTGQTIKNLNLRILSPINSRGHGVKFQVYATTDDQGRFHSESLYPVEYDVEVNSSKMRYPLLGGVKVEPGKLAKIDFNTTLPKLIEGRVLDDEGKKVVGVEVTLLEPKDADVEVRSKDDFGKLRSDAWSRTTSWEERFQLAILPGLEQSRFVLAAHKEHGWAKVSVESLEKGEAIRLRPWKP